MHKLESALENETYEIRWDCDIKMDHLVPTRPWDVILINRKKNKKKKRAL